MEEGSGPFSGKGGGGKVLRGEERRVRSVGSFSSSSIPLGQHLHTLTPSSPLSLPQSNGGTGESPKAAFPQIREREKGGSATPTAALGNEMGENFLEGPKSSLTPFRTNVATSQIRSRNVP